MRVYKVRHVHSHDLRELRIARKEGDTLIYDSKAISMYEMNTVRGFDAPYRSEWTPQWVIFGGPPENPIADFSYLKATAPLGVTQRVYDALGGVMDDVCAGVYEEGKPMKYGELLLLMGEDGNTYYLFRPPVIDALDEENSDFTSDTYPEYRRVHTIFYHTFIPERLEDAWLFYLATQPGGVNYYATEQFKQRVEEHGFTNIPFDLVWDSEDPDFIDTRFRYKPWLEIKRKFAERKEIEARVAQGKEALAVGGNVDPDMFTDPRREQPLSEAERQTVDEMINAAITMLNQTYAKRLGKQLQASDPPQTIVEAIAHAVDDLKQKRRFSQKQKEHRAIELGVLWAEQVQRTHAFHWAKVNSRDSSSAVFYGQFAVVADDRRVYVEPTPYLYAMLNNEQENTAMLLFNMLGQHRNEAEPGEYRRIG